ncbi:WXG100 family type VII secretion target [Nocardioides cavernae]|uniref:WXG100 family type VII secretion target n=1 Tax=Nocardioides cavernae TaxID=1921566 RepID=A0A7Y9H0A2_9ACTN|nr:WXG100 family type VII secretion target [Nocardioides cavernae]NYE35617.1 WXG100 family type VII secretion target [Nocardioides cavernae]
MTAFDVDLAELRAAVADLAGCQRDLLALAGDIDQAQTRLAGGWSGLARDAQATAYASWRDDCAAMVTALAGLRGIAAAADGHYTTAAAANVDLWSRVTA